MWNLVVIVSVVAGIFGAVAALLALSPTQWRVGLSEWGDSTLGLIGRLEVIETREKYWKKHIISILRHSNRLVILDAYQGHKHMFWNTLKDRLFQEEPLQLWYMILKEDDPFFISGLRVVPEAKGMSAWELGAISELKSAHERSPYKDNKELHFRYWTGFSPGPIISWTIGRKERIGLGFWVQLKEATDGTPYLVVRRGPLFKMLKRHYEAVFRAAKPIDEELNRVHQQPSLAGGS